MGNKYSVFAWVKDSHDEYGGYVYVPSYQGESLIYALLDMWKCKLAGVGCVKLEIR
jgi:hypothetical protein